MSGHDHSHALPAAGRRGRLAVVFSITATIMVAEVIGALASGSLALLADAGHMFTDSAGLLIALTATTLALRPATDKRTWGYQRAEIIAAAKAALDSHGFGLASVRFICGTQTLHTELERRIAERDHESAVAQRLAEQRREAGIGIEGRPAQPVDRAVAADERGGGGEQRTHRRPLAAA